MKYEDVEDNKNFLENFLKNYDFSDEGASYSYCNLEPIERFFIYMTSVKRDWEKYIPQSDLNKKRGTNKDPDSHSELLQKIYSILWKIPECMKYCLYIQGETLNSVNTTLWKLTGRGIENNISKYFEDKDNFLSSRRDDKEQFKNFVGIYHTLGNFMPIPVGCNAPRGAKDSPVRDYWDLTLKCIKNYYDARETGNKDECNWWVKKIVGTQLSSETENSVYERIERYKNWLNRFDRWENFVKDNYLEAFVENNEPISLWSDHISNWSNGRYTKESALPTGVEQCKDYFENAAGCIKKRGEDMIEKLIYETTDADRKKLIKIIKEFEDKKK